MMAELYQVEHLPWDCGVTFDQKEETGVDVTFQPRPMAEIMASLDLVQDEPESSNANKKETKQKPCLAFRPHPNTQVVEFDFERKVEWFGFQA